ncbi:MAG: DUF3332 family protein [Myxococcota bacterium]|nr:DUF3332 family protein [Myxococcota bacterium]
MIKRIAVMTALTLFALSSTGCIGSMALTGKVRQFNMEVSPKPWPREGVFVLLYVLPVYPFAGAADLLVVNSIEFWTGTNPISEKKAQVTVAQTTGTHRETDAEGNVVFSSRRTDGSVDVEVTETDGSRSFVNVQNDGEFLIARDADGEEYSRVNLGDY